MKVIYIAGAYRGETESEVQENIDCAKRAAIKLWKKGWAVICPHMNTAHMGGIMPEDTFIEAGIEMVKRCDAIFMLEGWTNSAGASKEWKAAVNHGIRVIYQVEECPVCGKA